MRVRLCMFHPNDNPMERGWVGRVDGDRVLHLAAQTLQAFFLGGGAAREHAEYALSEVTLLAPVLHPPNVRVFHSQSGFDFANTSAVRAPGSRVPPVGSGLSLLGRLVAVIGAEGRIGGTTLLCEWRASGLDAPKDRDFALVTGPVVVTRDELDPEGVELAVRTGDELVRAPVPAFDWEAARTLAGAGTALRPGDLLAGPPALQLGGVAGDVELSADGIGVLAQTAG